MKTRIKYAIIFGAVGFIVSFIISKELYILLSWLFIYGDGPKKSIAQDMIAFVLKYGIFIGFWLFFVYLGYLQGVKKESTVANPEK